MPAVRIPTDPEQRAMDRVDTHRQVRDCRSLEGLVRRRVFPGIHRFGFDHAWPFHEPPVVRNLVVNAHRPASSRASSAGLPGPESRLQRKNHPPSRAPLPNRPPSMIDELRPTAGESRSSNVVDD